MSDFINSLIRNGTPMQQQNSVKVCSRAGINLLSRERVKLEAMVDSLKFTVDELSNAKSRTEFAAAALLGLQLVKANCDAFIKLNAAAAKVFLKGPAAKGIQAVAEGYSKTQTYVGVRMAAEDGKFDVRGVNSMAKDASKKVPGAKYLHANVDIVHSALAKDYKALRRDIGNLVYEVHKDAGKLAVLSGRKGGYLSKGAARTLGNSMKLIDVTKTAVTALVDYSNAVEKAFDEKLSEEEYAAQLGDQIKTAKAKLTVTQGRLSEVNKQLSECYDTFDGDLVKDLILP